LNLDNCNGTNPINLKKSSFRSILPFFSPSSGGRAPSRATTASSLIIAGLMRCGSSAAPARQRGEAAQGRVLTESAAAVSDSPSLQVNRFLS